MIFPKIANNSPTEANPGKKLSAITGAEATPPMLAWLAVTAKNSGNLNSRVAT